MPTLLTSMPSALRRTRALLVGLLFVGASLGFAPTASADPATGPGAVSRVIAGALPAGTVPDGTCAAQVTAVGGGGASSPTDVGFGGTGGAGASISATFRVLPGQSFGGSVGGGGTNPTGGSGDGAVGTGGTGGTIVPRPSGRWRWRSHVHRSWRIDRRRRRWWWRRRGRPSGRTGRRRWRRRLRGDRRRHGRGRVPMARPVSTSAGLRTEARRPGRGRRRGRDEHRQRGPEWRSRRRDRCRDGRQRRPGSNYDSGGGGGGGYTGGGGGAATIDRPRREPAGAVASSLVSATSPTRRPLPRRRSPALPGPHPGGRVGYGATGSIAIDWLPCLYGLSVTKAVSAPTVNAGGAVDWTVTVTNNGPSAMTRGDTVTLTDLLPAGPNGAPAPAFEVLTFAVAGGANAEMTRGPSPAPASPSARRCRHPRSARAPTARPALPKPPSGGLRGLDPGETITITYRQIIANTAPCATITNTATVHDRVTQSGTTDTVGVVATRTDSANLAIACYDLAVVKVASPTPGPGR